MINTDLKLIKTDNKLLYSDITYQIRGAIFEVYNELGSGHKEAIYQKALAKEFNNRNIPFKREADLKIIYKGEKVGTYRPDFIIDNKIIIELKAVEFMSKAYEQQIVHYLKSVDINLGLLVNFGAPKLYIKRLIWTNP